MVVFALGAAIASESRSSPASLPARVVPQSTVDRAAARIEGRQNDLAWLAHPAGTLREAIRQDEERFSDSFTLTYRFRYTFDLGDPFHSDLRFLFDRLGRFVQVENVGTTALIRPFAGSSALISAGRWALLQDNPELRRNRELMRLLEAADSEGLVRFIMTTNLDL